MTAVVIRIPVEGSPQVRCEYMRESDEARMLDWLEVHPELLELIQRALKLSEEPRAA